MTRSNRRIFLCRRLPRAYWPDRIAAGQFAVKGSGALTRARRDRLTSAQVIAELKKGNERFRTGRPAARDYLEEQHADETGQAPAAVVVPDLAYSLASADPSAGTTAARSACSRATGGIRSAVTT